MGLTVDTSRPAARVSSERPAFRPDAEILSAINSQEEGTQYHYDESLRPEDMSYEWKRLTYAGMEDMPYQAALRRTGWVAVPASRHPEVGTEAGADLYKGKHNDSLIVGGQILMERHKFYTEAARDLANKTNRKQIKAQEEKLGESSEKDMPRKVKTFSYGTGQDID